MIPSGPILHVVQHLRPGGLEVMALELARAQSATHPAAVLSLEGDEAGALTAWPRLAGMRAQLGFMGKRTGLDPLLAPRLAALFRRLRPRCVHTHHVGPLLYAGPAARAAGVRRLVHTEHDAWHLGSPRRRRIVRAALALARPCVVADAPDVADAFAAALGRPPSHVILNGVDTRTFRTGDQAAARTRLGLPPAARIIGVAARLEQVKGVDRAIAALAHRNLGPPESRLGKPDGPLLAIAGRGTQREALAALAARHGVTERVVFLGHIDDMVTFYQAIDALCLPSRSEGLPLAVLEAQSCGVPVVAFGVGGVASALDPASGHLAPADDIGALAGGLARALAFPRGDPAAFVAAHASLDAACAAYLALSLEHESQ